MTHNNLSAKDEALLILEYLENEHLSKTFLNFLDENPHLVDLRSRLYFNYLNPEQYQYETENEVRDFQTFFNLSKQNENMTQTFLPSQDILFDDDFLNVGLNELLSQTPPMDYQHDLPDTPVPSVPPVATIDSEDFNTTLEQLFSMPPTTISVPLSTPTVQTLPKTSFTKCIVVTQDFLQSMYSQQSTITTNSINSINRPKRRRRRLKVGKENHSQQRKIMPRT